MILDAVPVRLRLSVLHSIWMGIVFSAIGVGVYQYVALNLYSSLDAAILSSAKTIRDAKSHRNMRPSFVEQFLQEAFGERFIKTHAQLIDTSGKATSASSQNSLNQSLPVTPAAVSRAEIGQTTYETFTHIGDIPFRQVTLPVLDGRGAFTGELVQVAAPLSSVKDTLKNISTLLWIIIPLSLALTIIFGYLLTGRSLRPVRELTRTASRLEAHDLSGRIPVPRANDEIKALSATFNCMLERLEDGFCRLRRFAGDVSHELRTPLTVLRAEADFALRRERCGDEYRSALRTISRESEGMSRIINDLLLLARAEGKGLEIIKEPISFDSILDKATSTLEPQLSAKAIKLQSHSTLSRPILCSPAYFVLVVRNILQNAIKHSPAESIISVIANFDEGSARITISDQGEGIPREALPYLFDPFFRVDEARNRDSGGCGIGLSLAQALVHAHDGTIRVDSELGKGTAFTITLPASDLRPESMPSKSKTVDLTNPAHSLQT